MKNKILVLLPDGVGIRNYLYSDVFRHTDSELILFHNFDSETIAAINENVKFESAVTLPDYKESAKEKFLRELICLSRLKHNAVLVNNPTILSTWKNTHKKLFNKIFYRSIELVSRFVTKYDTILALEKRYTKAIRKNIFYHNVSAVMQKLQPDVVFCLHQRGLKAATIFAAARDLEIATHTVIYSWDNLPKARLALRADTYLIWSEHMRAEMQTYYPEIPNEAMVITGTPQFEFYADSRNIIAKEVFYKQYDLDPDKKIICFSGDDIKTSPDDPQYLKDVAEAILEAGKENEFQILLRRCPVDFSGRFDAIVQKYNSLIKEATPIWYRNKSAGFVAIYPLADDVKLLTSTAFYADTVINLGSTMAFDFAMFNKATIFINYDQKQQNDKNWSVEKIYQFQHFRSMEDKDAVLWLDSKETIMPMIEEALSRRENPAMEAWKLKVLGDYKNASANVSSLIETKR